MASSPFLLQLMVCMICTVHLSVAIDDPVLYNIFNCSETSTSSTPAFQANLNSTLIYLISNSSTGKGFHRASSGTGVDTAANGIFLCRGDSSGEECQACVIDSSKKILSDCPNHKEAIIWSNHCMLRFSNRSIFHKLEEQPTGSVDNRGNATESNRFYVTLGALMGRLISEAVSSPASKFYAVGDDAIPESNNRLYGLVQCTPDITGDDCEACLRNSLGLVRKNGLIVLKPSCRFRFDVSPFYDTPSSLSWTPDADGAGDNKKRLTMIIMTAICIPTAVILAFILIIRRSVIRRKYDFANQERVDDEIASPTGESVQFDFGTIEAATNKFSAANKIGEGGFGPVYQGTLPYGQKIAIKRLSEGSNQGGQEFKNEVEVVAKLQHRNLVRLLGFCLHEKEKILVYEYVPNKSLDYFLFDVETQQQLDWETRIKIIQGIARGLLYLHEDSRLRIIHRDLKASNVLLDESMNPKISDFGTARILKVDQIQESTNRIVGTYGYMSPEYALDGNFSVKSDVFSFGVLMLEIISGKKNRNVSALLRHAWKQWREELVLELVDSGWRGSCPLNEVTRCVHIALLCVEEDPTDRPTMAIAVTMLNTFSFPLPTPKKPTCFAYSNGSESYMPKIASESDESSNKLTSCTVPR